MVALRADIRLLQNAISLAVTVAALLPRIEGVADVRGTSVHNSVGRTLSRHHMAIYTCHGTHTCHMTNTSTHASMPHDYMSTCHMSTFHMPYVYNV